MLLSYHDKSAQYIWVIASKKGCLHTLPWCSLGQYNNLGHWPALHIHGTISPMQAQSATFHPVSPPTTALSKSNSLPLHTKPFPSHRKVHISGMDSSQLSPWEFLQRVLVAPSSIISHKPSPCFQSCYIKILVFLINDLGHLFAFPN